MQTLEYLAFIPLLMYGLGLADLLSQWRRLFDPEDWYLPYTIFTVILTEIAVYNVFIYYNLLVQLPGQNYFTYLSHLLPPFLFILTTSAFTPEKDAKTKEHFIKRMPIFFTLLAVLILSHFIFQYNESIYIHIVRLLLVAILILVGFTRKIWPIYIIAVIWLISFLFRGKVESGTAPIRDSKVDQSSAKIVFPETENIDINKIQTINYEKGIDVKNEDADV
jgi:hypothetical protein